MVEVRMTSCTYPQCQTTAGCRGACSKADEFERVDTGLLCRAFGLSVAEAKRGLERTGFLYRRLASPPQDFHDAEQLREEDK